MMYFQALVLLFTVGATFGQTPDCFARAEMKCGKKPYKGMATTAEELKENCKVKQEFTKCRADFFGTCNSTVNEAFYENRYLENLKKGCDENNENYKVFSRNIGCIASRFDEAKEICMKLKGFQPEVEIFQNSISMSVPEENGKEASYCGIVLSIQTCASIVMSHHCGKEIQKPVAEMFRGSSRYFSIACSDDMVDRIEPYLGVFEESLKEKIYIAANDEEHEMNI